MRGEILVRVADDLLSVPSLISRLIRHKLVVPQLEDKDVEIKLLHIEILHVLKHEGTLHPAKIGERLIVAKAQMTHLIDKLVELEFVTREIDPTDRRTLNLTITEKGLKALEEQDNLVFTSVKETVTTLTDAELESLSGSLRNLRNILSKLQ
jgi:DNA-binding MarR family transcriptional regulator